MAGVRGVWIMQLSKVRALLNHRDDGLGRVHAHLLLEDPLGPFVVLGVSGGDFALPVVREPNGLQLHAEAVHVLVGGVAGMGASLLQRGKQCLVSNQISEPVCSSAIGSSCIGTTLRPRAGAHQQDPLQRGPDRIHKCLCISGAQLTLDLELELLLLLPNGTLMFP
eukprot:3287262-Pyramimonas_sp.AAC.2